MGGAPLDAEKGRPDRHKARSGRGHREGRCRAALARGPDWVEGPASQAWPGWPRAGCWAEASLTSVVPEGLPVRLPAPQ